jgi:hypothetical protein|tara:strand:- start:365 stop:586 length:222 start_codon:yes stop_codon:yes gene_type:complete
MIWVYVVALSFITIEGVKFTVQAPNMAFLSEEACQAYRIKSMTHLLKTKPSKSSRAVSQCFPLPFKIDKGILG